jgi:hypothetical protein
MNEKRDADDLNFHEICPPIRQNDQSQVTNTAFVSISKCVLVCEHIFIFLGILPEVAGRLELNYSVARYIFWWRINANRTCVLLGLSLKLLKIIHTL